MDTRDRLLAATRTLLWERGYAATSPKAILTAADAGQGSMYHHFTGKTDLARQALEATAADLRRDVATLLDGSGSPLERIEAYLNRQRQTLLGCPVGRMTFDPDVMADPVLLEPVASTVTWIVDALTAVVAEAQAQGEVPSSWDPHQVAATIAATVQGGYVLARAASDPAAFDAAVQGAIALLHRGQD